MLYLPVAWLPFEPVDPSTLAEPQAGSLPATLEHEVARIYEEHSAKLSYYAASFVQDPETAHDAVQEVFLRYVIERRYGREIENPRAWLYRVLRNYLLDRRKAAVNREVLTENLDRIACSQRSPEGILDRSETAQGLAELLSGREFDCLRLRAEGLEYAEIADVLGIRIGTVGALLSRAQKKTRRAAQDRGSTPMKMAEAIWFLFHRPEAH